MNASQTKVARLLLTNDDGIDAPGMTVLRDIAASLADEVWVVAPEHDRSGTGQSVTLNEPLRCFPRGDRAFALSGTPGDCVSMALFHLMKDAPPTFVLSGINAGGNIGDETNLSGTLGAAFASIMFGIPAIAVSQSFATRSNIPWDTAKSVTPPLLSHFFRDGWPNGVCLSVNIPNLPKEQIKGISWGMQSRKTITGMHIDERRDHREGVYYWQKFIKDLPNAEPNDCAILARGDVCVTALSLARSVDLGLPPLPHGGLVSEEEELPTGLLVSATLRIADRAGIPITIRRRGYEQSGTIVLKINRLDGTSDILTQIRMGDERVWAPVKTDGVMQDADAEAYMERQERADPDSWLLEIDDRQGRHWFPGRRID